MRPDAKNRRRLEFWGRIVVVKARSGMFFITCRYRKAFVRIVLMK